MIPRIFARSIMSRFWNARCNAEIADDELPFSQNQNDKFK